ncbi:MAG: pantetheine-phosphate adenylyltransferase [Gammaproteobacteria bacterium]|jgi:pantetheine-phosphate adenylyltransferase|nr:pantetheine-phosphate adenylyltransferase [Gammaproteobacteria bacterium]MBT3860909.1 pantetheine-phosphate adenylyltransferase [Gammaproteobacteria bacterium]MBT3988432.1 pantetheine-phosphate adenylyltransferase [Gammaproteobacteria bacterium]MBT4255131.1 pantetheine-phosphate adenylyltransferase [Gammaproteobacteria bacterium]MBT4581491.1 pantetheine-phosphate adenylyltransferase [Gammaproteobacteria bacterium]
MKIAVYPGTFNPITNGHTDLVERAAGLFDKIIVAVVDSNRQKSGAMPTEKRIELAETVLGHLDNVEVRSFDILLTKFVRECDSNIILRGLRTVADFEYEFQLVGMNRVLDPDIETVFLAPAEHLSYISSTLVREIASYGGDISKFVDPAVVEAISDT